MTFEWLIAMRYLRSRRRRMVSLITMISVAGVALGVFLLIVVGVALDTVAQIESHMLSRHYEGFLGGKGRFKGRR